jgi:hypothetical protein
MTGFFPSCNHTEELCRSKFTHNYYLILNTNRLITSVTKSASQLFLFLCQYIASLLFIVYLYQQMLV